MPLGMLKFRWWWDNLYWSIDKGVFDDGLVLFNRGSADLEAN